MKTVQDRQTEIETTIEAMDQIADSWVEKNPILALVIMTAICPPIGIFFSALYFIGKLLPEPKVEAAITEIEAYEPPVQTTRKVRDFSKNFS